MWSENASELGSAKLMVWDQFLSHSHLLCPWTCSNNPVVGQFEMGTLPISAETVGFYWKWFYIQWIKRKKKKATVKSVWSWSLVFACIFYLNCHEINYWSISKSAYCVGFSYDDLPLAVHVILVLALCGENVSPVDFGVL